MQLCSIQYKCVHTYVATVQCNFSARGNIDEFQPTFSPSKFLLDCYKYNYSIGRLCMDIVLYKICSHYIIFCAYLLTLIFSYICLILCHIRSYSYGDLIKDSQIKSSYTHAFTNFANFHNSQNKLLLYYVGYNMVILSWYNKFMAILNYCFQLVHSYVGKT